MKKINQKGMAVSAMIYTILLLFLVLMLGVLGLLGTRKVNLDKLKLEVLTSLNSNEGTPITINSYVQEGKILHYDGYSEPVLEGETLLWKDLSGTENHATILNSDSTIWNGKGIVMDGVDDILSYMGTLTDAYTIEMVMQVDLDMEKSILFGGNGYPTLYLEPTLDYSFALSNEKVFGQTLSSYKLHTLTLTSDKTTTTLYIDGEKVLTTLASEGGSVETAYLGGIDSNSFKGVIYSYMVYNRVLNENEIKTNNHVHHIRFPYGKNKTDVDLYVSDQLLAHYDGYVEPIDSVWNDISGNGYSATITGVDTTSGWQENGILLDGVDDYITSMMALNSTEGTISLLVSNYKDSGYILRSDVHASTYITYNGVTVGDNSSSVITFPNTLNQDIHQVVMEWKTENSKLYMSVYLDGVLVEENKEFGSTTTTGSYITIGSFGTNAEELSNIKVYNMKYYDKALSSAEIKLNYALDMTRYID